jgi:hypothetical protein
MEDLFQNLPEFAEQNHTDSATRASVLAESRNRRPSYKMPQRYFYANQFGRIVIWTWLYKLKSTNRIQPILYKIIIPFLAVFEL